MRSPQSGWTLASRPQRPNPRTQRSSLPPALRTAHLYAAARYPRRMRVGLLVVAFAAAACGDGLLAAPDDAGDDADASPLRFDGGFIALPDCGYNVVTRLGAERPRLAPELIGFDPTPRHV